MPADSGAAEANRLYWESDLAVAAIAERLDISRRALYDAVEPLPAPGACPACGGALGYPNRTARDGGAPVCAACGAPTPSGGDAPQPGADRTTGILVAALVGTVAGTLSALLLRRFR